MLGAYHSNLGNLLYKLIEKLSEFTNLALNLIFEVHVKKAHFIKIFGFHLDPKISNAISDTC